MALVLPATVEAQTARERDLEARVRYLEEALPALPLQNLNSKPGPH
jgi:hypothetical protein